MLDMFPWEKLSESREMKRILVSLTKEIKAETSKPDSGFGLALKALIKQVSDTNSTVMEEANLTFTERQVLARIAGALSKEFV